MRINHNVMASNANRYLSATGFKQSKSLEKISSGLRINTAADDAAGLAISEKMRAQVSGLEQAADNALDGISLLQTAEGALQETHSILQRMRELAVQSANDTNTQAERDEIQKEVDELAKEITRIANNTEFNSKKISNGGLTEGNIGQVKFHIGANTGQDISLSLSAMDAKSLGVSRDVTVASGAVSGGTNISEVAFDRDYGSGVVDGKTVEFTYDAATAEVAAVAATWTSNAVSAPGSNGGTVDFTFMGVTVTVTRTDGSGALGDATVVNATTVTAVIDGANDADTATQIIKALNAHKASAHTTLDEFTFSGDETGIVITGSTGDGATNNAEDITGGVGQASKTAGVDFAAATNDRVTITNTTNALDTQTIDVTGTDTQLSVNTGAYEGLNITMAGASTLADLVDTDEITITTTLDSASAATFSAGELDQEAYTAAGVDMSTQTSASAAIETIENAISSVSAERSKLGAYQNRLEHTINNLNTTSENLQASESRIRDVDIAKEMMNFTKLGILQQAAQSMLAQANQAPQGVLQLLR